MTNTTIGREHRYDEAGHCMCGRLSEWDAFGRSKSCTGSAPTERPAPRETNRQRRERMNAESKPARRLPPPGGHFEPGYGWEWD